MRTQIPKFLLGSPQGWKRFDASADFVILPGFSSDDAAATFCQTEAPGFWELQYLGCGQVSSRLKDTFPEALKLVAINPGHAGELSLLAMTLDTACHALRNGENTIVPEYRLMRDHCGSAWNHTEISVAQSQITKPGKWYVACLHPQGMKFVGGQPLWFWLDWFDGKHVLTECYSECGGDTEREFFIFRTRGAAEGFYEATAARLQGCICQCQIDSLAGREFKLTMWEKDRAVCNRTSTIIGKR